MVTTRERLHRLLDELPDLDLPVAERYLEHLHAHRRSAFPRVLAEAPEDDEPETEDERVAVEEAWREYREGKGRPWEEVRQELAGD